MHNSYLFDRVTVRGRLGEQAKNKTWFDLASLYYYSKLVWLSSYSASSVHFNLSSLFNKRSRSNWLDGNHSALYKLSKTDSLP